VGQVVGRLDIILSVRRNAANRFCDDRHDNPQSERS